MTEQRDGILDPKDSELVRLPPEVEALDRWRAEPDNLDAWNAARRWLLADVGHADELDYARSAMIMASDEQAREKARQDLLDLLDAERPFDELDWSVEPPALEWLVPAWLPLGRAGLLTGIGGRGKSTLVLQLAVALAAAQRDWIGGVHQPQERPQLPESGPLPVVVASWEERHGEMARRAAAIAEALGLTRPSHNPEEWGRLRVLDMADQGPLWAPPAFGKMPDLTASGRRLRKLAGEMDAALLVIDPLDATFAGDENHRAQVRAFMASWDRWASDARCSVLFVAHPNKQAFTQEQGEGAFSGSTAWHGASRALWTLEHPTAVKDVEKVLRLSCVKTNYADKPAAVWMERTERGVWQERGGPETLDSSTADKPQEPTYDAS